MNLLNSLACFFNIHDWTNWKYNQNSASWQRYCAKGCGVHQSMSKSTYNLNPFKRK